MSENQSDPVRFQVAEAGFGAMLERHGFQLVPRARCHWRRDGEGVTWRVAIKEKSVLFENGAHWLDIHYGCEVHGADALQARLSDYKISDRLPGTSKRAHSIGSLSQTVTIDYMNRHNLTFGRHTALGRFFYMLHPFEPTRFEKWFNVPFVRQAEYEKYFLLSFHQPELPAAVQQYCHLFEEHALPDIEEISSVGEAHDLWYGPDTDNYGKHNTKTLIMAKLAGRQEHINLIAKNVFEKSAKSFQERNADVDLIEEWKNRNKRYLDTSMQEYSMIDHLAKLFWTNQLLESARILELDVQNPGIDVSPYLQAKADWGPDQYYPDKVDRFAFRARGEDWTLRYR